MYNRVILMGRLTRDPEMRQTQSGISMCRITIAVERSFARQGEERQTDFFDITFWRQQADFVNKYFTKGRMIHVEGRLQNDNYTDQSGVKHYRTAIVADNVTFCGDKRQDNGGGYTAPAGNTYQSNQPNPQQYNSGSQYQGGGNYGGQQQYGGNSQYGNAPQQAAVNNAPQSIELGDLGDFEEILSDGEVPF